MRSLPITVRDIGSFFVGGQVVSLTGLPRRGRISTTGGPVHLTDPNGEITVGQKYVSSFILPSHKQPFRCICGTAAA